MYVVDHLRGVLLRGAAVRPGVFQNFIRVDLFKCFVGKWQRRPLRTIPTAQGGRAVGMNELVPWHMCQSGLS